MADLGAVGTGAAITGSGTTVVSAPSALAHQRIVAACALSFGTPAQVPLASDETRYVLSAPRISLTLRVPR